MLSSSGGVRLGKLFGFPIFADGTLLLVVGFLVLWELQSGIAAFGRSALFFGLLISSVLLHEVGHAVAVRRLSLGESIIILSGLGGRTVYRGQPTPRAGIVVALAGPLMGFALGIVSLAVWAVLPEGDVVSYVFGTLATINLVLNAANLLPIFPLDGGQVVRFALRGRLSARSALRTTAIVGGVFLAGAASVVFLLSGFSLIIVWLLIVIIAVENVRLWSYAAKM